MGGHRRKTRRPGASPAGGIAPLVGSRVVPARHTEVFDLLDDLHNHDWIGGRWLDVVDVADDGAPARGATLVLRRPFLPDRTAVSTIEERRRPTRLVGTVEVPGAATARLAWDVAPSDGRTLVVLTVTPLTLRRRDRLWLAAGGRRWIQARIEAMLGRLEDRVGA
ncbi:SRPBCC family protein [Salsipaludibacter albus]|uniref:SRPBCC family protein n=1 Tax=Salsipaludibacter albus TaxID=2849650 RepID=UPI001EE4B5E1|nr:SRPBCC family protein [Salsipaludibacter albus]MBY5161763.1 SRPBCC family protein [Salsipaludibacter albus]